MIIRLVKNLIFIAVFYLSIFSVQASAQSISSIELIKNAKNYDGRTIIYQGEIIGERLCRKDGCWLNVNDGNSAIGIWVPDSLKFIPKYTGGYKFRGDLIEVEGVFNYSCKQHLGEMDIHAERIRLIKEGERFVRRVSLNRINLTLFIWSLLCLILILMRLKKI